GSFLGGTAVTITGTGFVAGATVEFNGVAAGGVTVDSATQISATTPADVAGPATVKVINADLQAGTLTGGFTYLGPAPTIAGVAPPNGGTNGADTITITGTNLLAGLTVTVGGVAATSVVVVSTTEVTAVTPAGSAGAVDVVVTTADTQSVTSGGAYTYVIDATPTVTSVSPASGTTGGGTRVTITGTDFAAGATATFGGVAATAVTFVSATTLTATTPAGTAGAKPVAVSNPDSQTATRAGAYSYIDTPAPTVTAVSPDSGPLAGGAAVTITGTGFLQGIEVLFGSKAATNVVVVNATIASSFVGSIKSELDKRFARDLTVQPLGFQDFGPPQAQISRHLRSGIHLTHKATELDPNHFIAWALHLQLLFQSQDARGLASATRRLTAVGNVPAGLAYWTLAAMLSVPQSQAANRERIADGWSLLQAVPLRHHTGALWKLGAARLYLAADQPDQAVTLLQEVLELQPGNVTARQLVAYALYAMRRYGDALECLEQIPMPSSNPRLAGLHSLVLVGSGDRSAARDLLRQTVASGEPDPALRLLLASLYLHDDDAPRAADQLELLARQRPFDNTPYSLLGQFYLQQQNAEEGLAVLQRLEELNRPAARLAQASLLSQLGRSDDAINRLAPLCRDLVDGRDPRALWVARRMAQIYVECDQIDAARSVFDPLIEADLLASQAVLTREEVTPFGTSLPRSLQSLDRLAQTLTPQQHGHRYRLMLNYARRDRPDRALDILDDWIALQPDSPNLLRARGELLIELGNPSQATAAFQAALQLQPDDHQTRIKLSRLRFRQYDFPAAESLLRQTSQRHDPNRVPMLLNLASLYGAVGLQRQARIVADQLEPFDVRSRDPASNRPPAPLAGPHRRGSAVPLSPTSRFAPAPHRPDLARRS
ncbi:MAG: tetratricopeptide repeat protein, partial [Planctomycetes bacterium]|nr:tetratricopeptide repeat protein [Planctomycetota bacterium]